MWTWKPLPDLAWQPDSYVVTVGTYMPNWLFNAFARKEAIPLPVPEVGDEPWGLEGFEIVATGKRVSIGEVVHRRDLALQVQQPG
jgi:hypothetical protein